MNERIRELANKAGYNIKELDAQEQMVAEKFAMSIVKEAGEYLMRPEFIGRSDLDWSMVLNEHFGVD